MAGSTTGTGRHEIEILADLVSFEVAWELIRATLARRGLLGAVTVRLVTHDQERQSLWPPP